MLVAALNYAERGWSVFPCHQMHGGVCSCEKRAACKSPGKHPVTDNGWKNASRDEATIRGWFSSGLRNVAVATGEMSGIVVLDIDSGKGGDQSLEEIERRFGRPPDGLVNRTGSGGIHLFFSYAGAMRNKQKLGGLIGVDVRGDGGYVVMPPSNHKSGGVYFHLRGAEPADAEWMYNVYSTLQAEQKAERKKTAKALLAFTGATPPHHQVVTRARAYLAGIAPAIEGNDGSGKTFCAATAMVRGFSLDRGTAVELMREYNQRCVPPWDDEDLVRKVDEAIEKSEKPHGYLLPDRVEFADRMKRKRDRQERAQRTVGGRPKLSLVHNADAAEATGEQHGDDEGPAESDEGYGEFVNEDGGGSADGAESERPTIRVNSRQLFDVLSDAVDAIVQTNNPPTLFRRSGTMVRLQHPDTHGGGDLVRVERVSSSWMLGHLATVADWVKVVRDGEEVDCYPPKELPAVLLERVPHALPVLDAIVGAPVFDRDGHLINLPGYHPDARLWYCEPEGLDLGTIPEDPTEDDAHDARDWLFDRVLGEFPFVSDADRAHAVAGLLLPFVRRMFVGCSPLHMVEAPVAGTGKTYLTMIANILVEGSVGHSITPPLSNDEETGKTLFSKLLRAPSIVRLDNLNGAIDSPVLAEVLTGENWESRLLGASQTVQLPIRCAWWATANNPKMSTEIGRRCVRIRLNPKTDRPQKRQFRTAHLDAWVISNRGLVLSALFVLVRRWIHLGRPKGTQFLGGYNSWAETMGGILSAAGISGFLENQDELYELADEETTMWQTFCAAWADEYGDQWVGASALWRLANAEGQGPPLLGSILTSKTDRGRQTQLGSAMTKMRDRVFDGRTITLRKARDKTNEFRLAIQGTEHLAPTSSYIPTGFGLSE